MLFKKKFMIVFSCLVLVLLTAFPACTKEESGKTRKPQLHFYSGLPVEPLYSRSNVTQAKSRYEFDPVLQGDIVNHDFIIKNDSREVLELSDVEGCCGCFVKSYSRKIQPGLTGKISVLILTDSRGGQEIRGTVRAATNDKSRPEITIEISIFVKEFASLSPYRIWLKGEPGEDIVEKCIVIPNEDYPFEITGIKVRKGVWFDYSYREIETKGKKGYEITVKNTRKKVGPYQDVLFVQTDNSARPEFKIRIEGRIGEAGEE